MTGIVVGSVQIKDKLGFNLLLNKRTFGDNFTIVDEILHKMYN